MKAISLLFLIISAALAASVTEEEVHTALTQFESNEYAKNIMNILQIEQSKEISSDEIISLLQKLKFDILKEQEFEQDTYKVIQSNCRSLLSSLGVQIPLYEKTIKDTQQRLADAKTEEAESKQAVKDAQAQLSAVVDRADKGKQAKAAEQKLSSEKTEKIKKAIKAINEAVKLVRTQKISSKAAISLLDEKISEIFTIGSEFELENIASYSTRVRTARDAIATTNLVEVQDRKSRKLVQLLNSLGDMFRAALLQEETNAKASAGQWAKLEDDLKVEAATLKDNISHLQAREKKAGDEQKDTAKILEELKRLLDVSSKSKDSITKSCGRKDKKHEKIAENTKGDIEIIDKLIEFFKSNQDAVKKYIRDRSF